MPAGLWLGQQTGWRTPFAVLTGLGVVTGLAMVASLPGRTGGPIGSMRGTAPDARRYALLMVVTTLAVTGTLSAFTYITPYLLRVGGFTPAALGPLLLVNGVAGVIAVFSVSAFVDRRPWLSLTVPLAVTAVAWLALYVFGTVQAAVVVALALAGLGFNALPPASGSRILHVAPGRVDFASAGASSTFNIGIASGSFFGGLLLAGPGVHILPLFAAVLTALALALMLASRSSSAAIRPETPRRRTVHVRNPHSRPAGSIKEVHELGPAYPVFDGVARRPFPQPAARPINHGTPGRGGRGGRQDGRRGREGCRGGAPPVRSPSGPDRRRRPLHADRRPAPPPGIDLGFHGG